jgi:citrate lyase beta subunit
MPIIESKNVMYRQRRMDQLIYLNDRLVLYSDNVLNIRVGATDFCSLFGIRRNIHSTVYDMNVIADCLADVVNVFARNYICSGPVWEFFNSKGEPGEWSQGLQRELFLDKLNGFTGKTCIHPSQLKYVQESNIVTYEQYKDATAILGMADGFIGVKKGYNNNKMNEVKTHTTWARRVIGRAEVFGVLAEGEPEVFNVRREYVDTGVVGDII